MRMKIAELGDSNNGFYEANHNYLKLRMMWPYTNTNTNTHNM